MSENYTRRVVNVLLGLRMLSEGSTYRWDKERTSSTGDVPIPVRFTAAGKLLEREWGPYEYHHHRLQTSPTPDDLRLRLREAEDALERAKARPVSEVPLRKTPAELRRELIDNFVGVPAGDAAYELVMSVSWVRKVRKENRKHPATGDPTDDKWIA